VRDTPTAIAAFSEDNETVAAIQSFFEVFGLQVPIFQDGNLNPCWRLSRCLGQEDM